MTFENVFLLCDFSASEKKGFLEYEPFNPYTQVSAKYINKEYIV